METGDSTWVPGTLALAGLVIGAAAGLLLDQIPVGAVIGLAVGVALDARFQRNEQEKR